MAGASDPFRWKRYFGQFSGDYDNNREIETYDSLMAEYAGIAGVPIIYYTINVDQYKNGINIATGENSSPLWDRSIQLTALQENWSNEAQKITTFNLENIDELVLFIHRSTFDKLIGPRSENTPVQGPNLTPRPTRRGGYGPITKDIVKTLNNDLYYEVITGGLHFLESNAQHFGHKFWYKLTLKPREPSAPIIGTGEQYGLSQQTMTLEQLALSKGLPADYYKGNSQFVIPTPSCDDLLHPYPDPELAGTVPPSSSNPDSCGRINYQTTGGNIGPLSEIPDDYYLPDGRIADKYRVEGPKSFSNSSDTAKVQTHAETVIDPQSNLTVTKDLPSGRQGTFNEQSIPIYVDTGEPIPANSEDYRNFIGYNKYGPSGKVVRHSRELWGDW
jgi:hypothetical protein